MTGDQVISIWTGKVTNWKDVGGNDLKITIINRPASSGTRATFKKYALKGASEAQGLALTEDSTGAVAKAINDTPGAVGYLGLAYFLTNKDLKQIKFNGKDAVAANFSDDSYPIWSYGHMYTKGEATGLAKAFIDYILSDDIQTTLVPQLGIHSGVAGEGEAHAYLICRYSTCEREAGRDPPSGLSLFVRRQVQSIVSCRTAEVVLEWRRTNPPQAGAGHGQIARHDGATAIVGPCDARRLRQPARSSLSR